MQKLCGLASVGLVPAVLTFFLASLGRVWNPDGEFTTGAIPIGASGSI